MDSSRDRSKRRKFSADSGESTGPNRGLLTINECLRKKKKSFNDLYEAQYEENANPTEVNALCGVNGQTATCALKALDHYNQANATNYVLDEGGDSNILIPSAVVHPYIYYVHLNFDASDPINGKRTFFAELVGTTGEPHGVKVVAILGSSVDEVEASSAEHICSGCTGLRHPLAEESRFTGYNLG